MQSFRAAVIQTASAGFDAARSIDKLAGLISEAAAKGVKLAVLPEAFIGGYPKGLDSGVRIGGSRTPEGRELLPPLLRELRWRSLARPRTPLGALGPSDAKASPGHPGSSSETGARCIARPCSLDQTGRSWASIAS